LEIFLKNRNFFRMKSIFFGRIHDPQTSNQIDVAECMCVNYGVCMHAQMHYMPVCMYMCTLMDLTTCLELLKEPYKRIDIILSISRTVFPLMLTNKQTERQTLIITI